MYSHRFEIISTVPQTDALKITQPPRTLREMAQSNMRDAIISGHFEPGQRLVERSLCEQIGVSRSVIREVIRTLEAEGLVEVRPNQGPIVARMDWTQAEQIYDIRALLEASAVADCATRIDPPTLQALRHSLDQLIAAGQQRDPSAVLADTHTFYTLIFESAGHHMAWEIVQRLNGRISRLRVLTLSHGDRLQRGPARLEDIYTALANADPQAAEEACRLHVGEAKALAQLVLGHAEHEPL